MNERDHYQWTRLASALEYALDQPVIINNPVTPTQQEAIVASCRELVQLLGCAPGDNKMSQKALAQLQERGLINGNNGDARGALYSLTRFMDDAANHVDNNVPNEKCAQGVELLGRVNYLPFNNPEALELVLNASGQRECIATQHPPGTSIPELITALNGHTQPGRAIDGKTLNREWPKGRFDTPSAQALNDVISGKAAAHIYSPLFYRDLGRAISKILPKKYHDKRAPSALNAFKDGLGNISFPQRRDDTVSAVMRRLSDRFRISDAEIVSHLDIPKVTSMLERPIQSGLSLLEDFSRPTREEQSPGSSASPCATLDFYYNLGQAYAAAHRANLLSHQNPEIIITLPGHSLYLSLKAAENGAANTHCLTLRSNGGEKRVNLQLPTAEAVNDFMLKLGKCCFDARLNLETIANQATLLASPPEQRRWALSMVPSGIRSPSPNGTADQVAVVK